MQDARLPATRDAMWSACEWQRSDPGRESHGAGTGTSLVSGGEPAPVAGRRARRRNHGWSQLMSQRRNWEHVP